MTTCKAERMSGLKAVSFYRDSVGCTCDRCGTYIKNVALVTYVDGERARYGSECIEKVLGKKTTLAGLWRKNARLLKVRQMDLEALELPEDQMNAKPGNGCVGHFIIRNRDDKWVTVDRGCIVFHPTRFSETAKERMNGECRLDMRSMGLSAWEPCTEENMTRLHRDNLEKGKAWLRQEIAKLQTFLARVLAKGLIDQATAREAGMEPAGK